MKENLVYIVFLFNWIGIRNGGRIIFFILLALIWENPGAIVSQRGTDVGFKWSYDLPGWLLKMPNQSTTAHSCELLAHRCTIFLCHLDLEMIDIDIKISISERSSGWATNYWTLCQVQLGIFLYVESLMFSTITVDPGAKRAPTANAFLVMSWWNKVTRKCILWNKPVEIHLESM